MNQPTPNLYGRPFNLIVALLIALAFTACEGNPKATPEPTEPAPTETPIQSTTPPSAKLNLNTATEEQFLTIPDVGNRMVHEFFEYRPYVSIQQFRREIAKYVSDEQVTAYEQYVYVPINPNECDAATLQQIPGVDETEAAALMEGRPYASNASFLEKLAPFVSDEALPLAETYLQAE